ncbi:MarR family winged helix-turn-helix transcriptional regulator [Leucobacter albus]|uniref:MarR family winged helix-turn-helix transcriptional regulator n=1 Tax=Leucobacter albus TaxID=272210 RepID=A0ABW3TMK2_9MICO
MESSVNAQQPTPGHPTQLEADALIDALGRLRGRRGGRGGRGGHPHPGGGYPRGERGWAGHPGEERTGGSWGPDSAEHGEHDEPGRGGRQAGGRRGRHDRGGGPALLRLLGTLAHAAEPLSISELADHIGVDQPRASRLVQQAVEHGHAVREVDPNDARRTRVRLTDSGLQLVHGVRGQQRDEASAALAALSGPERAELLRLLAKLAEAWPHR